MRKIILLSVVLLAVFSAAAGEDSDGRSFFINGKTAFDAGRYTAAVENFSEAYKRLPAVRDYILFFLARAHSESGNISESNTKIKELLKDYPLSTLRKKARRLEIKNLSASGEMSENPAILESYVRDHPEDNELKLLLARHLKDQGEAEKAKALFKKIYLSSEGIFSQISSGELEASDITLQDIIEKAANLANALEFKKAESALREALAKDNGERRLEIYKKLGHVLFRQRRYKESADAYEKAGDNYLKAKALYRAGDKTAFEAVIKKLSSAEDQRTGSLLLLAALDKRRNGGIDEALNLYKTIKEKYPSESENAQWGIAWIYYRAGAYQKAFDVFTGLYETYGSSKYLYWKAQALERTGGDAGYIYRQLMLKPQDFYTVLARIKRRKETAEGGWGSGVNSNPQALPPKPYSSERIDILLEAGMIKDAAAELSAIAQKTMNPDELISVSLKLQECGEYRTALTLLSRLPSKEIARNILYPLAYWNIVRDASEKYGVDPFVVLSIIREESRFDTQARSRAGALGLMQLMPQTAYALDKKVNMNITSQEHIFDIKANINLGTYYMASLLKEFGSLPAAAAAYNAGEDLVRKWQRAGSYKSVDEFIEDLPYDETKNYTKRVITTYFEYYKYAEGKDIAKIF